MEQDVAVGIPRKARLAQAQARKFLWAGLAFLLLVASAPTWPWFVGRWKAAQARKLIEEGAKLAAAGEPERAMPLFIKAWQKAPAMPSVLRELARRCDEMPSHATDAVSFWRQLEKTGGATPQDRIALAAALVKTDDGRAARVVLQSLTVPERLTLPGVEIEAALLREEGRNEEASGILYDAWKRNAQDPSSRLNLAMADFSSPFDDVREEARGQLWEIARAGGKQMIEAVQTLASAPLTLPQVGEIRGIVSIKSGITSADRLRVLGACIRQQPALAAEIVAEESRRLQGRSPESKPEFYEWLAHLGMATPILHDLSEEPQLPVGSAPDAPTPVLEPKPMVLKSRDLFLAYGDALITSRKWKDFAAVLSRPGLPVHRIEVELMQALCARGLSEPAATVEAHLATALNMARNTRNPAGLSRVAAAAEEYGLPTIALEALDLLSADRRSRLDCLKRMFRLQQELSDPDAALRTAEAILQIRPGMEPYADEALYLSLLTGNGLEQSLHRVATSPESAAPPGRPLRRLAAALAAYQSGETELVRQRIEGLAPRTLPAGPRAVLAGLLAETGRGTEALRIAEKITSRALSPDEFWFYKIALR